MIRIIDTRRSGKTTKLLRLAHGEGLIVVEPTKQAADYVKKMAKDLGYDGVNIISSSEFMSSGCVKDHKRFLIDELEWFLESIGVCGYSNNKEVDK